ncbi:MAG: hypothetical protein AAGG80_05000, partial [Pseudomonadota bacterium]
EILEILLPRIRRQLENQQVHLWYTRDVIKYLLTTTPDSDVRILEKLIKQHFNATMGENIMNAGQQLRQEGIELGIQQGMKQGVKQGLEMIAINLLKEKLDLTLIARSTGLSKEKLLAIKQKMSIEPSESSN